MLGVREPVATNVRRPSWFQPSDDIKPHVLHLTGLSRVQSVALLYVGALSSIFSCVFTAFLGIYKFLLSGTRPGGQSIKEDPSHFGRNFMGDEFPSGKNFYPATLGGMVHDTASDDGKVFMAFSIIGAVCLLASAYPWHLKSVYVTIKVRLPGLDMELPLNLLRQFLPVGQLLACCIQLPQSNHLSVTWRVAWGVHWIGLEMCYGGYLVIEAVTIGCFGFDPSNAAKFMTEREIRFRKSLMWTCAISALVFVACSILLKWPLSAASCDGLACSCNHAPWTQKCTDVWVMPTRQNVTDALNKNRYLSAHRMLFAISHRRDMLVNTASGWVLGVKQFSYTMEVTFMLSIYLSQMVIWFFSRERKVDLDEDMPTLTLNVNE